MESRYDTASVAITILDVNDNAPEFPHSPYLVRVPENGQPMISVFKAEAKDRDNFPFNEIEYGLRDGFDGLFVVNSTTGKVQQILFKFATI